MHDFSSRGAQVQMCFCDAFIDFQPLTGIGNAFGWQWMDKPICCKEGACCHVGLLSSKEDSARGALFGLGLKSLKQRQTPSSVGRKDFYGDPAGR